MAIHRVGAKGYWYLYVAINKFTKWSKVTLWSRLTSNQ
jgi:hypothetical protein